MAKDRKGKKRWGKKHEDKRNWKEYNEHLIKRGLINPWFLDTWEEEIEELNNGKVGQPYTYPKIEFLGILKSKGFDYRALQGIVRALSHRLGPFPVISFSQIRRRINQLTMSFHARSNNLVVMVQGSKPVIEESG